MTTDAWHVLSGSLQILREEYDNTYTRYQGLALPGSPAALELQADDLAGEWGACPVQDAYLGAIARVPAVMDHLDALGVLFASPGGLMASYTVARSVLDIATKSWFLLEPEVGARERVRRHMNYRLQSLKEQSLLVGDSQSAEAGATRQGASERTERILRAARHHGFFVKGKMADKVRPCYLGPDRVPSTTEMAGEVITPGGSLGALLWRTTSAVAHGQTHGLMMFYGQPPGAPVTGPDDHFEYRQMQSSPQDAALGCAGAPFAALTMLRRLYSHCGWPAAELETVGRQTQESWLHVAGLPHPANV
ncbi:hypothetical protein [Streptomyces sp. NPDC048663]|uniref:hypothetical protein n=1 Tax=Streptomyces sp. NPDC048663 TaxID=3155638 RepID=UPI00342F4F8E